MAHCTLSCRNNNKTGSFCFNFYYLYCVFDHIIAPMFMKKLIIAGIASCICVASLSSCQKRQYVCTCTYMNIETEHLSGIYRSKKDAKNWCTSYEKPVEGTSCVITN